MAWPVISVELAIGASPTSDYLVEDDPDRGILDQAVLAPDDLWTDISAYVFTVNTKRGRQRLLEAFSRGQATIVVDSPDGRFDPNNLSGPYVQGGETLLRPEIRMRIRATVGGVTYPIFLGFVDSYQTEYGLTRGPVTTIKATDGFKVLARYDPPAESNPVGAGETTGARIARLLNLAGWPVGDRDLDTGLSTVQATTAAQNSLTEIQLTADSEGPTADVWVGADGKVVFRDRHYRYERTTSRVVQALLSDAAGQIHYESLDVPEFDDELVKNSVSIAATGSTAASATNSTSQTRYFVRPWSRHDLIFRGGTTEARNYADSVVFLSATPEQRIDGIKLMGVESDTTKWAAMFGLDFGHRVHVVRTPEDDRDPLDRMLFIEGVEHTFQHGFSFETSFRTSSATQYDLSTFILNDASYGVLDDTDSRLAVY